MIGDLRLRQPEPLDQFPDRQLALVAQQLEDPYPRLVTQPAEVPR